MKIEVDHDDMGVTDYTITYTQDTNIIQLCRRYVGIDGPHTFCMLIDLDHWKKLCAGVKHITDPAIVARAGVVADRATDLRIELEAAEAELATLE